MEGWGMVAVTAIRTGSSPLWRGAVPVPAGLGGQEAGARPAAAPAQETPVQGARVALLLRWVRGGEGR